MEGIRKGGCKMKVDNIHGKIIELTIEGDKDKVLYSKCPSGPTIVSLTKKQAIKLSKDLKEAIHQANIHNLNKRGIE